MAQEQISVNWNPWHGCTKLSEGCRYCYVYRQDSRYEKDSSVVTKTASFDLPVKRKRDKSYKIPEGSVVYTCFTSDFLLKEADPWRAEAWEMMRRRHDLTFIFFTKRIDRFDACKPADWGDGYPNVAIGCTCENQQTADYRLPIFRALPVKYKLVILAPLLGRMDLTDLLSNDFNEVSVGGESGLAARVCDYDWVLDIRRQCVERDISFSYHQTGARLRKDGRVYYIRRPFQHSQARRANIAYRSATKPYRRF